MNEIKENIFCIFLLWILNKKPGNVKCRQRIVASGNNKKTNQFHLWSEAFLELDESENPTETPHETRWQLRDLNSLSATRVHLSFPLVSDFEDNFLHRRKTCNKKIKSQFYLITTCISFQHGTNFS